jgi:uncharacterized pyridoxamine 5'-phosphate oxidase family protein
MADFNIKSKRDEEVETLATNLRRNRLASSDSEARRMAEEMLSTSKKVHDDFTQREKTFYGDQKKNPEVELAHRQIEQLASNLARGKSNVRINIPEINVDKPLRELVTPEYYPEKEDDEEVVKDLGSAPEEASTVGDESDEAPLKMPEIIDERESAKPAQTGDDDDEGDEGDVGPGDLPEEPLQAEEGEGTEEPSEEQPAKEEPAAEEPAPEEPSSEEKPAEEAPAEEENAEEDTEEPEDNSEEESDFEVKEL